MREIRRESALLSALLPPLLLALLSAPYHTGTSSATKCKGPFPPSFASASALASAFHFAFECFHQDYAFAFLSLKFYITIGQLLARSTLGSTTLHRPINRLMKNAIRVTLIGTIRIFETFHDIVTYFCLLK